MKQVDYAVIGLGPAGMACTLMAHSMGVKVTAIERRKIGGECLNYGCIPSKALIKACKVKYWAENSDILGFKPSKLEPQSVFKRVRDVVYTVNHGKTVKMFEQVDLILGEGDAVFEDDRVIRVGEKRIKAKKVFLCLGTTPRLPRNVPGFEKVDYLTNETVFDLDEIPSSIIVLGGGPIGCELGQCFSRLGAKVSIINNADRLLPRAEPEAGKLLEEVFKSEGIQVYNNAELASFDKQNGLIQLNLRSGETITAERLLVAIGRELDYSAMNLEKTGVEWTRQGIKVNDWLETTNPHIYAVGDCNGYRLFTHSAMHQGMCAVMNSLIPGWLGFLKRRYKDYVVPWSVFTEPEVSSVGFTKTDLDRMGIKYDRVTVKYSDYGRSLADGSEVGFVTVYFKRGIRPTILGALIVGENSSEMIQEWGLAIQKRLTLMDIMFLQHSFPTFGFLNKRVPETWMMHMMQGNNIIRKLVSQLV